MAECGARLKVPLFAHEERVHFGQIDLAGIVFFARFFEMLNNTVEAFFTEALKTPFESLHAGQHRAIPVGEIKTRFLRPSRLGERLVFKLAVEALSDKTMTFKIDAFGPGDERRLEARMTHVYVEATATDGFRARPIPPELRCRLEHFMKEPAAG